MKIAYIKYLPVLVLGFILVACGGSDGGGDDTPPVEPPVAIPAPSASANLEYVVRGRAIWPCVICHETQCVTTTRRQRRFALVKQACCYASVSNVLPGELRRSDCRDEHATS